MAILDDIFNILFPRIDLESCVLPERLNEQPNDRAFNTHDPGKAQRLVNVVQDAYVRKTLSSQRNALRHTANRNSSLVDFLNALGLDSRLQARVKLAKELGYFGNLRDHAVMDKWVHTKIMAIILSNDRAAGFPRGVSNEPLTNPVIREKSNNN